MEYISAEEFLKQDKEVQKVFLDWWKPSIGDLFYSLDRRYDFKIERIEAIFDDSTLFDTQENKGYYKPLFTEGQLRKFIEDHGFRILEVSRGSYTDNWYIKISNNNEFDIRNSKGNENLLLVYWEVALEIVKESLIKR
jgi:hypothetical protein